MKPSDPRNRKLAAALFPFLVGALLILCAGCVAHKTVNATYETYGVGLQAPPTPVSPPFGLTIGYTKVTYGSAPTSTNELHKAK